MVRTRLRFSKADLAAKDLDQLAYLADEIQASAVSVAAAAEQGHLRMFLLLGLKKPEMRM
jgi:hypothetical protein